MSRVTKKKAAKPKETGDRGLPLWPRGKKLPKFKSHEEEVRFWQSFDFQPPKESEGEELVYEPRATRRPRHHVYQVRFDDREMAKLQHLAKRRGVPASVILRELVRGADTTR